MLDAGGWMLGEWSRFRKSHEQSRMNADKDKTVAGSREGRGSDGQDGTHGANGTNYPGALPSFVLCPAFRTGLHRRRGNAFWI